MKENASAIRLNISLILRTGSKIMVGKERVQQIFKIFIRFSKMDFQATVIKSSLAYHNLLKSSLQHNWGSNLNALAIDSILQF